MEDSPGPLPVDGGEENSPELPVLAEEEALAGSDDQQPPPLRSSSKPLAPPVVVELDGDDDVEQQGKGRGTSAPPMQDAAATSPDLEVTPSMVWPTAVSVELLAPAHGEGGLLSASALAHLRMMMRRSKGSSGADAGGWQAGAPLTGAHKRRWRVAAVAALSAAMCQLERAGCEAVLVTRPSARLKPVTPRKQPSSSSSAAAARAVHIAPEVLAHTKRRVQAPIRIVGESVPVGSAQARGTRLLRPLGMGHVYRSDAPDLAALPDDYWEHFSGGVGEGPEEGDGGGWEEGGAHGQGQRRAAAARVTAQSLMVRRMALVHGQQPDDQLARFGLPLQQHHHQEQVVQEAFAPADQPVLQVQPSAATALRQEEEEQDMELMAAFDAAEEEAAQQEAQQQQQQEEENGDAAAAAEAGGEEAMQVDEEAGDAAEAEGEGDGGGAAAALPPPSPDWENI